MLNRQFLFYPLLAVGTYVSQTLFVIAFVLWISVTCGWFQRFVLWWVERELRRVLNDTPVTIGGLTIHWWHGQLDVYNIILHTPLRQEWQWQSPLIARVGKISIQVSVAVWAYSFLQYGPRHLRLEIYTIRAEDVQVFVERQQHIFNFYLLDPMLELPDPSQVILTTATPLVVDSAAVEVIHSHTEDSSPEDVGTAVLAGVVATAPSASIASPAPNVVDGVEVEDSIEAARVENEQDQQHAQQLVNDMVLAVQSLGEAAQRGKITTALHQHRQSFASKLKQLTQQQNSVFFKKGVKVMQQVSHAVVQNNKRGIGLLPFTPPTQRGDRPRPPPIHGRVGRILIRNVRVFTRATTNTTTNAKSSSATAGGGKDAMPQEHHAVRADQDEHVEEPQRNVSFEQHHHQQNPNEQDETIEVIDEENSLFDRYHSHAPSPSTSSSRIPDITGQTTFWNKPLYIQQVVLRASELCPPKSLVERGVEGDDDDTEYPAIYQPLDKVAQVVLKRLLAEMAKSNTGRLLETAMGEVLAYLQVTQTTTTLAADQGTVPPTAAATALPTAAT